MDILVFLHTFLGIVPHDKATIIFALFELANESKCPNPQWSAKCLFWSAKITHF